MNMRISSRENATGTMKKGGRMKSLQSIVVGSAVGVMLALPAGASLVMNGDFAVPVESPGAYLPVGSTIPGWTVVGSGNVTIHHVFQPTPLWPGNTSQFMDLTGNTGSAGVLSDPIATIAGQTYQVTFDALNGSLVYPGINYTGPAFSLQASGGPLANYSALTDVPAGVPQALTYSFTAVSTSTTLTFLDTSGFDSNAGWIDNVSLALVPEPPTMIAGALLLLPFGASTLRILRKRTA
jgi:hypothetical protein